MLMQAEYSPDHVGFNRLDVQALLGCVAASSCHDGLKTEGWRHPIKKALSGILSEAALYMLGSLPRSVLVETGDDLADEVGGCAISEFLSDADQLNLPLAQRSIVQLEPDRIPIKSAEAVHQDDVKRRAPALDGVEQSLKPGTILVSSRSGVDKLRADGPSLPDAPVYQLTPLIRDGQIIYSLFTRGNTEI
jgi:hypothetical protein